MNSDLIDEITKNIENMEVPDIHDVDVVEEAEVTEVIEATDEAEQDVIKFKAMKEDLEYSIKMLRNNINNSERILTKLTRMMIIDDEEISDSLSNQYTQIDAGMNKNIELLQKARKDISIVISNLNKAKAKTEVKQVTNNVNIETKEILSTADIVAKIKGEE